MFEGGLTPNSTTVVVVRKCTINAYSNLSNASLLVMSRLQKTTNGIVLEVLRIIDMLTSEWWEYPYFKLCI